MVQVKTFYANVFLLTTPQGRLLVDTGTLLHARAFGRLLRDFKPDALLLTHSHIDHAANAFLAARLGVPVLAHPLEHPALLGQVHDLPYPAGWPAVGRAVSRGHPKLRPQELSAAQPGQDVLGWEVVHLPGHTAGQVGLRRGEVLLAADALLASESGAHLPRPAYNSDHAEAERTLQRVAALDVSQIYPGHGPVLTLAQVQARARRDWGAEK